jgi:hypothetical protein
LDFGYVWADGKADKCLIDMRSHLVLLKIVVPGGIDGKVPLELLYISESDKPPAYDVTALKSSAGWARTASRLTSIRAFRRAYPQT